MRSHLSYSHILLPQPLTYFLDQNSTVFPPHSSGIRSPYPTVTSVNHLTWIYLVRYLRMIALIGAFRGLLIEFPFYFFERCMITKLKIFSMFLFVFKKKGRSIFSDYYSSDT